MGDNRESNGAGLLILRNDNGFAKILIRRHAIRCGEERLVLVASADPEFLQRDGIWSLE